MGLLQVGRQPAPGPRPAGGVAAAEGGGAYQSGFNCVGHPWIVDPGLRDPRHGSVHPGALEAVILMDPALRFALSFWVGIGIAVIYVVFAILMFRRRERALRRLAAYAVVFTVMVIVLGGSQYWLGAFIALAFIAVGLLLDRYFPTTSGTGGARPGV